MDFMEIVNTALSYFYDHTLLVIGTVVVVGGLTFWKPKAMLRVVLIAVVISVVAYFLSLMGNMASTGVSHKREMINKDR